MTRTEELTLRLLEGAISEEQTNELEWTIASDPAAAKQHVGLLELEAALRGRRKQFDVVGRVMTQIRSKPTVAATAPTIDPNDPLAAMAQAVDTAHAPDPEAPQVFDSAPPPDQPVIHRRRRRKRGIPVTMYVLLGLMVVLVIAAFFIRRELTKVPPTPVNQATFAKIEGKANIIRDGTTYIAQARSVVNPGEQIKTAANSIATLVYDPAHEVRVRSESVATLEGTGPAATQQVRQIRLDSGALDMIALAESDKPDIEVITPHAVINAGSTRYSVEVDGPRTTVLVERGLVDVRSKVADGKVQAQSDQRVVVEAGLPLTVGPADALERIGDGLVVLYMFNENGGDVVSDLSRREPKVDLKIADPAAVTWGNRLLRINQPTTIKTESSNAALIDAIRATDAITIEAWLKPNDAQQHGPAAIVSLGSDPAARNVTLAQGAADGEGNRYNARFRTIATGGAAEPAFMSNDNAAQPELTHLVYTRHSDGAAKFYINGTLDSEGNQTGGLINWASDAPFGLANEATGDRPWLGELRLVALYNRALTAEEIEQNMAVGLAGPVPTDGAVVGDAPQQDQWEELTGLPGFGPDRTPPFTITGQAFRIRLKFTKPEGATEPIVARLRDFRDATQAQEILNSDRRTEVMVVPARFGPGEYYIEVLTPEQTDWEFRIEQRIE